MANLNFQQPPRSITNQNLSRSAFNPPTLSGHVTPTSGMFPSSTNSFTPSQLSPQNRSMPPVGNRSIFNQQRVFSERRSMQQSIGSVVQDWNASGINSMAARGSIYGSQSAINNLQSVFNNSNSINGTLEDNTTPPLLDLSEFPSLTSSRATDPNLPQTMPGKQPYVGMVKAPTVETNEFTMSNEDFPALPGTQSESNASTPSIGSSISNNTDNKPLVNSHPEHPIVNNNIAQQQQTQQQQQIEPQQLLQQPPPCLNNRLDLFSSAPGTETHLDKQLEKHYNSLDIDGRKGIQTFPDGKVTEIPPSMVNDQFGIIGLLSFIRAAETDPNLVSLALGADLTTLGLNLNSPENLYSSFGGPWMETPCRPMDLDYSVPTEYLVNIGIRDKLPQIKLGRYKDEVLFLLFYMYPGDALQLAAAYELYNREWRYHIEEKIWITQAPGFGATEKTATYERGTYFFFDPMSWRKVAKEFHLEYSKLENRPSLPTSALTYV